jgi:hypothetical protein
VLIRQELATKRSLGRGFLVQLNVAYLGYVAEGSQTIRHLAETETVFEHSELSYILTRMIADEDSTVTEKKNSYVILTNGRTN